MERIFEQFLKDNNAFEAYKVGYKQFMKVNYHYEALSFHCNGEVRSYIRIPINWTIALEGRDYWYDLDCKWIKVCDAGLENYTTPAAVDQPLKVGGLS